MGVCSPALSKRERGVGVVGVDRSGGSADRRGTCCFEDVFASGRCDISGGFWEGRWSKRLHIAECGDGKRWREGVVVCVQL